MDLKEFVRETLVQVTQGVNESQDAVRKLGGFVNPYVRRVHRDASYFAEFDYDGQHVFLVDFDVAVTVAEGTGTHAEAKLQVASIFSLGAGGSSSDNQQTTSRIHFKVPLALPLDADSRVRVEESRKLEEEAQKAKESPERKPSNRI